MEVVADLVALDRKLAECDAALRVSDDALRRVFGTFRMGVPAGAPEDPFGAEYRAFQMGVYERVAGKPYTLANEAVGFSVAEMVRRPFPYSTGSLATTGNQLTAIGFLLRQMELAPGARVLEFGPGWGNTTLALALLGMRVTAVDIEANFCALLRGRAAQSGVALEVVQGDFFWAETVREPFDAVLFFECFHHCDDHLRLLRALHGAVRPGGSVYFACEPVEAGFAVPWGVRMDGESLWAIRNFGWLELGFEEGYFRAALARAGWAATRHASADLPWATVWRAQRLEEAAAPAEDRAAALGRELAAVYASRSWRVTRPLRAIGRLVGR